MRLEHILAGFAPEDAERVRAGVELLARQALGSAVLQGEVETLRKADDSPVTVVDLLHQTQVQGLLADRFRGDGLIGEEPQALQEKVFDVAAELSREHYGVELGTSPAAVPARGDVTWVVDPIDGTKGFLAGRYFAIALGYFREERPVFGAIAVPGSHPAGPGLAIDGAVAFAVKGCGAWIHRPARDDGWRRLAEPPPRSGPNLRIAVSLAHGGPLAERVRATAGVEVVAIDSQAKYLAVATGVLDAYMRAARDDGPGDVIWDHMPAGVVAREAGCRVEHFDGEPVTFEPREQIEFRGGFVCYRERPDGSVAPRLRALLA